jgi:competence protein ComEC
MTLWAIPLLFGSAMAVTLLCAGWPGLSFLAALPTALARYVLWAAGKLAALPFHGAAFSSPVMAAWLVFAYLLLAVCLVSRERRRKYIVAALVAAVTGLAAHALPALAAPGGALTVVAVDVGQGAATLLSSGGETVLVDCGSLYWARGPGNAVADAMESFGWESLDYVALTHYHQDHAGGLGELLARVEVERLLLPVLHDEDDADLQSRVLALAEEYNVPVTYVESETELPLGRADLTVFPPLTEGDVNEEGLTVLCTAGDFDVLITGDMGSATEKLLVEEYPLPDIEVLLVGHHGSKYATSDELLDAVTPEVGIISVGENRYGHPTQEAMERMTDRGMELYRTDLQGNIVIQVREG